jgi:hypothetical protein
MRTNQDRSPGSWDELLHVLETESGRRFHLRGASPGDVAYARSLRDIVSVNWSFDTAMDANRMIVTPRDGGTFYFLFAGGDPNQLIRSHLRERPTTRP